MLLHGHHSRSVMAPSISTQKGRLSHFGWARDLSKFAASMPAVGSWCGHGEVEGTESNKRRKGRIIRRPGLLTFALKDIVSQLPA